MPNIVTDADGKRTEFRLLTVLGSAAGRTLDHTAAIVLETEELGTLGFLVDAHALAMLRRAIGEIEQFLHQPPGLA